MTLFELFQSTPSAQALDVARTMPPSQALSLVITALETAQLLERAFSDREEAREVMCQAVMIECMKAFAWARQVEVPEETMTKLNKIIHGTAKTYAEDFPGEPLDKQWSVIAYEIAGADEIGLSWTEFHAAVEVELANLTLANRVGGSK